MSSKNITLAEALALGEGLLNAQSLDYAHLWHSLCARYGIPLSAVSVTVRRGIAQFFITRERLPFCDGWLPNELIAQNRTVYRMVNPLSEKDEHDLNTSCCGDIIIFTCRKAAEEYYVDHYMVPCAN